MLILSREFLITGLRLLAAGKGRVISAGKWGKHKTTWQIIVIIAVLLGLAVLYDFFPDNPELLETYAYYFDLVVYFAVLGVAILTVLSGLVYFKNHLDVIEME